MSEGSINGRAVLHPCRRLKCSGHTSVLMFRVTVRMLPASISTQIAVTSATVLMAAKSNFAKTIIEKILIMLPNSAHPVQLARCDAKGQA